jgi:hypothetical protein
MIDSSFAYIASYSNPDGETSPLGNRLSGFVKEGSRDFKSITEGLVNEKSRDRDVEILKSFLSIL